MTTSRRTFLRNSLAAGTAFGFVPTILSYARTSLASQTGPADRKLRILILGGTGFLGPATVEAAQARGHTITLFNRGKTEKRKGGMFPDVEKLYGNRDPDKRADDNDPESPKGLESLKGHQWDAVIDNSGYFPRMAKASAELLAPSVRRYIFVSSVSAYASNAKVDADESEPTATLADPTVETMGTNFENYGGLKALCEQAVEKALPGRTANVRPGYIVGPGDTSDRFTYWPVRADKGGEMLAPGSPDDPIEIIDVRDLGAWLVRLAENGSTGIFNAVGPEKPAKWEEVVEACVAASSNKPTVTWVPADFITENAGPEGGGFPIWIPPVGEYAGFHRWKNTRARAAGLTFRPIADTARDTLAWFKTLPEARQAKLNAGPSPEQEAKLLEAWKSRDKKTVPAER
ncbi:MAG TPA: hypothetical protein VG797_06180 [Phycisphaerales bacterium]|nr:hypothetical protein [Phycisphaerales bacterium]